MRVLKLTLVLAAAGLLIATVSRTQQKEMSDADYIKTALSAAPAAVAKDAGVMRVDAAGKMKILREAKNDFTCMIAGTDIMCNDKNSMEFISAMLSHTAPPDKVGISYMLAGDHGASNTDPYATAKTADNHWLVTGPHIMVFGPPSKTLGYTEAKDPDPNKPYMMWAGTPYEHAMIPISPAK
ncbi:MAG TPA: hypothetical protein VNO13_00955 [Candidatus Udaeobacter sp.]|jgi:hypothetical protein|nr:hypothetical protein [Candidatus Udaeobacter sp.]